MVKAVRKRKMGKGALTRSGQWKQSQPIGKKRRNGLKRQNWRAQKKGNSKYWENKGYHNRTSPNAGVKK